jgi:2-polyprenyl-6-methoxyphenol hydroxylase-like FAD-dependent oxidoreductase
MTAFPKGFLVLGDALCTFTPIYAQGMSAAAQQADILRRVLSQCAAESAGLDGLASTFSARATEANSTPWNLAAAFDFAFPQTRGTVRPTLNNGRATSRRPTACSARIPKCGTW